MAVSGVRQADRTTAGSSGKASEEGVEAGKLGSLCLSCEILCGTSVTGSSLAVSRGLSSRAAWKACHLPPLLTHPQLWRTGAFKETQYAPSGFTKHAWPQICDFFFNRINPAQKFSTRALFLVRQALMGAAFSSLASQKPRTWPPCGCSADRNSVLMLFPAAESLDSSRRLQLPKSPWPLSISQPPRDFLPILGIPEDSGH